MSLRDRTKQMDAIYGPYLFLKNHLAWLGWELNGHSGPPPHLVKQRIILRYREEYHLNTLVETGTYLGETVRAIRSKFDAVYSIELSDTLYKRACGLFAKSRNVHLLLGDSSVVLPSLLAKIECPCLFWLDAHYSGGVTAIGAEETPILVELKSVLMHPVRGHVVLIDDAHCFLGRGGYPTLDELHCIVREVCPTLRVTVCDNVIRIVPGQAQG